MKGRVVYVALLTVFLVHAIYSPVMRDFGIKEKTYADALRAGDKDTASKLFPIVQNGRKNSLRAGST